jgi:hypothetical protein
MRDPTAATRAVPLTDFSAQVQPQPTDGVAIDSSADATVITLSRQLAFTFDGTSFVPLPALNQSGGLQSPMGVAVRGAKDVWALNTSSFGEHSGAHDAVTDFVHTGRPSALGRG